MQEFTQNAIDVRAKHVEIIINAQGGFVTVSDDGSGVGLRDFSTALESLMKSSKGQDKFGRFGRGLINALTKCREFTFTSRAGSGPYRKWTFHCQEILDSEAFPQIPSENIGKGPAGQWWKTQAMLKGVKFKEDAVKYAVDIEVLKDTILSRFATGMRRHGTVVKIVYQPFSGKEESVTFSAKSYEGDQLPVWEYKGDSPAGRVVARLYRAKEGTSPIPVTIGQIDDPFRVDWKTFYSSVTAFAAKRQKVSFDGKEINDLLKSGFLTGEIECENITIHPDREKFERNEALDYFVIILEDWFKEVGSGIYAQARIRAQSNLYQQVAIEATRRIENHPLILDFLKLVRIGSVGDGHAKVGARPVGEIASTSATRGADKGLGTTAPDGVTVNSPEDKVTREKQVPMTVDGPQGAKRTLVRGESKGLRVAIEPFPGLTGVSAPLFRMDIEEGLVVINQLSPSFNVCADSGKTSLHRYIDMVIVAALQSAVAVDPAMVQTGLEQYIKYVSAVFANGDQRKI